MTDLYHCIGDGYLEVWCSWKEKEFLETLGFVFTSVCWVTE